MRDRQHSTRAVVFDFSETLFAPIPAHAGRAYDRSDAGVFGV